ncbi:MAG: hypothetical protein WAV09_04220 [Minisyncoccia bacterium]
MKGYTNKTEIENYLLIDIDASFWTQVERWIEDIETYIDQKTGRNFIADSVASAHKYDGDNTSTLLIEDCVEVTEVKIGTDTPLVVDESGEDDEYFVYPANMLPKTKIRLTGGYFPKWPPQTVSIKAKWGYSAAVPADIRNAATILVAGIINYSLNADGEVKSMSIGRYTVTYKDEKQWQDFDRMEEVFKSYIKYTL